MFFKDTTERSQFFMGLNSNSANSCCESNN